MDGAHGADTRWLIIDDDPGIVEVLRALCGRQIASSRPRPADTGRAKPDPPGTPPSR